MPGHRPLLIDSDLRAGSELSPSEGRRSGQSRGGPLMPASRNETPCVRQAVTVRCGEREGKPRCRLQHAGYADWEGAVIGVEVGRPGN